MKTFIATWARPSFFIILSFWVINTSFAQSAKRKAKEAKTAAEVKSMIDAKSYVFVAQYVQPMRGGNRYVTPEYDLRIGTDSLVAYLPYFGRAYVAPMNSEDAGVQFTTTKFDYKVVEKKDSWEVSIVPKNAKDVRTMQLTISKNGYATLRVSLNNRDPISYQGYVEVKKQKV
ncbi:MAG: DUF4251 domain-containing protein [Mucilaginibacter sp.]|uniref:DUF4251 domain-containing protein n=1 Tax=Mucilaginibacter sp. TaxID=1882438 RepID=UPI003266E990